MLTELEMVDRELAHLRSMWLGPVLLLLVWLSETCIMTLPAFCAGD